MSKILIATPMMPPTAGGPATHAKKLSQYFGSRADLFNSEKYKKYPSGIRHLLTFLEFLFTFRKYSIIFALDAFTVALPAVLAGKITNKKVVLRVGGDFVAEQYVQNVELISLDTFYEKLIAGQIKLPLLFRIKLVIQKFIIENANGIIFNTKWQQDIYSKYYKFPQKTWVFPNPSESLNSNVSINDKSIYKVTSITRDIKLKNLDVLKDLINQINQEGILSKKIILDHEPSSREEVLKRISSSDLYVCLSIYDIAPNQLLEALSLGLPSICTKNTGYFSMLQSEVGVKFVDPKNREEIKKAVVSCLNQDANTKMRQSLQSFKWQYSWENYFKSYESIIAEIS